MKIRISLIALNGDFFILRGSPERVDKCLHQGWVIGKGAVILCETEADLSCYEDELLFWEKFLGEADEVGCAWWAYKSYVEWCTKSFMVWHWMVDPSYLGVSTNHTNEMVFHIDEKETMLRNLGSRVYN